MTSELDDLITALREGSMSLDEVAQRFRERSWPRTMAPPPASYLEMATVAQEDPEPFIPGSFEQVAAAYRRGELTRPQYRVLAEAVAESSWAKDQRSAGDQADKT
jgi:hypothetical protein